MKCVNVQDTDSIIVDLDTGTILGSNLVVLSKYTPDYIIDKFDDGYYSDDEASDLARDWGVPLFVDLDY